jgi:site-specific DNA recombinase
MIESVSIGTQKLILEKFCKENDFNVYGVCAYYGFLRLNFERPEIQKMLKDIEDGKINLVLPKT